MFYYGDDRSESDSDSDDDSDELRTTTPKSFLHPIGVDSEVDLGPVFMDCDNEDEDEDDSGLPDVMMPADWLSVDLDIDSVEYSFDTDGSGDRESMSVTINVTETQ